MKAGRRDGAGQPQVQTHSRMSTVMGKQPRKEGSELRKKELQGVGAEACGTPDSVRQGRSPE